PSVIWYGEGDDMWLIDGEPWPGSLHGTGTEDFFNTAWGANEHYLHPYFGIARTCDGPGHFRRGKVHSYRFFLDEPIFFEKSIHGSIEHGHANAPCLDLASVTYWYQSEPHKPFPALPPKEGRQNMPPIDVLDIHRWRHAWRVS